jgi:predicted GIY-YIG superfamily endonuclease
MHWIYILKCYDCDDCDGIDNSIYYVGQTKRLYGRFWEHIGGRGGINTSVFTPQELVAIYKVSEISKFIDYNEKVLNINNDKNLEWTYHTGFNNPYHVLNNWDDITYKTNDFIQCENNIAECLMIHNKNNWENIRGGKYVRFDCAYKFPNNDFIKELPLCNCGLPCDVKKHKQKNSLYFRCAKKNMWDDLKEKFEDLDCIEDPCKFYQEYFTDIELRIGKKKEFENRKKQFKELFSKSQWLKNIHGDSSDPYGKCVGNCGKLNSDYKYIKYDGRWRTLCYDCFIDKNHELKRNYDKPDIFLTGKCLIVDDY